MGDGGEKKVKSQKTERSRKMDGMEMYSGLMAGSSGVYCHLLSTTRIPTHSTLILYILYRIADLLILIHPVRAVLC